MFADRHIPEARLYCYTYRMQFEGQHEGEEVLFYFRQHPVVLRRSLIVWLGLTLVGMAIAAAILQFLPTELNLAIWVAVLGFVVGLLWLLYRGAIWHFSMYIVTDQRIIQDQKQGLFKRQVIEIDLDKIQSVNYEIPGFQAAMFKFGTIVVQTFVGDLVVEFVHRPAAIHNQLTTILREYSGFEPTQL